MANAGTGSIGKDSIAPRGVGLARNIQGELFAVDPLCAVVERYLVEVISRCAVGGVLTPPVDALNVYIIIVV